jgi:CRP-like cAMP-binding protein
MPRQDLESRLAEITREFVTRLVHEIRNASFAEVAALPGDRALPSATPRTPLRPVAKAKADAAQPRSRRSAAGRAEVGEQVLSALRSAGRPMGVRDLAEATGLTPEALAAPLRELRTAGKIRKHGDKRATKYGVS